MRISDELLDELGERFVREGIYERTLIPFSLFVHLYLDGRWVDAA